MKLEDIIIRILAAGVIGALIGSERKKSGKPAGITTHLVVCLGAALIVMIQNKIDENVLNLAMKNPEMVGVLKVDTARIPAQIVSGIGFLGGGVILHSKNTISGITTAATIWITAGLGMGAGFGYFDIIIPTTIFMLLAMYMLKKHGIFSDIDEVIDEVIEKTNG
ncbi:MAG: MgtC/SapB family protein [Leptotrichiaceae bacterium]|nr:MgtC/SapB family protein [Leptotrichiaceae bacterium]